MAADHAPVNNPGRGTGHGPSGAPSDTRANERASERTHEPPSKRKQARKPKPAKGFRIGLLPKFLILGTLLATAITADLVVSGTGVRILERDVANPLASIQGTLVGLVRIRRETQHVIAQIEIGELDGAALAQSRSRMLTNLDLLTTAQTQGTSIGTVAFNNLRSRIEALTPRSETTETEVRELLALVLRFKEQVITDSQITVDSGKALSGRVTQMIWFSALLTLIALIGSAEFIRRWVLEPVRRLRMGVQRFAEGDLEHRVPVPARDELGILADELNTMAGTIDQLQRKRIDEERLAAVGEMTQRIVHNLRSPLTGIRALAEMTRSELPNDPELQEAQTRIIASVDRFEGWLRGILTSTAPLQIQRTPTQIGPWLQEVAGNLGVAAEGRGVLPAFETRIGVLEASIDPHHLEHALTAVVANAIDAAGEGGRILVRADRLDIEPGQPALRLAVSDTGPGIPETDHEQILSPYFTTKPNGTGIGLAFTRAIVEAHGGQIRIKDAAEPLSGAMIELIIPIDDTQTVAGSGHK